MPLERFRRSWSAALGAGGSHWSYYKGHRCGSSDALLFFVVGSGVPGFVTSIFFTVVGVWAMRSWTKVAELRRLSLVMGSGVEGEAGR